MGLKCVNKKETLSKKATERFSGGYNCAQSVLLTIFEHWKGKNDLIPKIATGFGGGIGRCGSVCGALTGGVMAIGVRYGTDEQSPEKRQKAYELSRKLYKEFENRHGSVFCKDLIGYDLSNPDDLKKARSTKVSEEKCPVFIRTVMECLIDITTGSS
jgi:C_GCAxxG_C_C family probable redox protein